MGAGPSAVGVGRARMALVVVGAARAWHWWWCWWWVSAARAWRWRWGSARSIDRTCVATSGFHAITELRCARLFELVKLMTGFLSLRSHTTERPLCEVDARMCVTFRFHATHDMSARGALLLTPGE